MPHTFVPRVVFWELTSGCNLHCIHCRASAQPGRSPFELETTAAFHVIDDLASFAKPVLILTGGEPLYRPDFFDIATHAREAGLPVAVATNGTLVDDEVARRIAGLGVHRVSISIDGASAATHDSFRGLPGAFAAAMDGIEALKRAGVPVQINTTIARHNVNELPKIVQLALDIGAVAMHLFMLVPVGCGLEVADEQMLPAAEYEHWLNWFYDRAQEVPIELRATCAPHFSRIVRQRSRLAQRPVPAGPGGLARGCLAGTSVFFISHLGKVYPCGYLPVEAGDVRKKSLAEIWYDSPVFQRLRDPDQLGGKCGVCEYKNTCGGCRARAFAATGDFMAEEPYCTYQPGSFSLDRAAGDQ